MIRNLIQGVDDLSNFGLLMKCKTFSRKRSLVVCSHSSMASMMTVTIPTRLSLAMAMNILQSSLKFLSNWVP